VKLYIDEDISPKVADLLRKKGVDAVSAHERGMIGASDEDQLIIAANESRATVTRNRNDFITLTVRFFEDLKPHHGLLIIPYSIPGSDFKLMADLLYACTLNYPDGLASHTIEFVSK
jgi:hypothetical protein